MRKDQKVGNADVKPFLEKVEEVYFRQNVGKEEQQEMWNDEPGFYGSEIAYSPSIDRKIREELVPRLRGLGRFPEEEDDSGASRILWSFVLIDIMERTGPDKLKQDTDTPRKLADIIGVNHLTNRLKGEYRDDSDFEEKTSDGKKKRSRRVKGGLEEATYKDKWAPGPYVQVDAEIDDQKIMGFAAADLSAEDYQILKMWREDTRVQEEIAAVLDIGQSKVSRHLEATLELLRRKFADL